MKAAAGGARLAFWGSRDMRPESAWSRTLMSLVDQGHALVAGTRAPDPGLPGAKENDFQVFPSDFREQDYLEIPITASALRVFAEFSISPIAGEFRQVAMAMLSRRDISGTFRFIDREVVIRRLGAALTSQLLACKPTHLIFEGAPHEPVDYILFILGKWMGIKTLFFQTTSVGPQILPRTSLHETHPTMSGDNQNLLPPDDPSQIAFDHARIEFERIVKGEEPFWMRNLHQEQQKRKRLSVELKKYLVFLGRTLPRRAVPSNALTGHGTAVSAALVSIDKFLTRSLRNAFDKAVLGLPQALDLGPGSYAIFALHYEPEATTLPGGLPFVSQLDAVLAARAFLPTDITLIVKEHFAQSSGVRYGFIGRSPLAYELLDALPGVQLLGPGKSVTNLARQAKLIFTVTGTVGIEMPSKGVPVVYLGNPWWEGSPGTYKLSSNLQYENLANFQTPSVESMLSWFYDFSTRCGFGLGGNRPGRLEDSLPPLPNNHVELEYSSLLHIINGFICQNRT